MSASATQGSHKYYQKIDMLYAMQLKAKQTSTSTIKLNLWKLV